MLTGTPSLMPEQLTAGNCARYQPIANGWLVWWRRNPHDQCERLGPLYLTPDQMQVLVDGGTLHRKDYAL